MKKIVLNISDADYEKFRFEAIFEEKDVSTLLRERIFYKEFHPEVIEAYDSWMEQEINKIASE